MYESGDIEENCKAAQELIVESNTNLDKLAWALSVVNTAKKKLMLEAQDLNHQIGRIKNTITTFGRNKMSLDTQLEDIKRLTEGED